MWNQNVILYYILYIFTLNEDWNVSLSLVGILNKVQSLAISAPVVDNSDLKTVKNKNRKK